MGCCKGCVPPKRTPYCHSDCPEYTQEKADRDRKKAEADAKKAIAVNLTAQTLAGVNKANRRNGRK